MNKIKQALNSITEQGVLPLYFHEDANTSKSVLRVIYEAGIRAVEYTNRGKKALSNFRDLRKTADKELPGMLLGIGTIKSRTEAKSFIKAGAQFLVSPGMVDEVGEQADKEGLLWLPGCMTPTEMIRAEQFGATFIKVFPGNLLGPAYISSIKELFPGLQFMPTGGVELSRENISAWFRAGVSAVGMGSKLISKPAMDNEEFGSIKAQVSNVLGMVRQSRVMQ